MLKARVRPLLLTLLTFTLLEQPAIAVEAMVRAPVSCIDESVRIMRLPYADPDRFVNRKAPSCGIGIDIRKAQASWQQRSELQRSCAASKSDEAKPNCDLVPQVFSNLDRCDGSSVASYYWAPAASFPDGQRIVDNVLKYLRSGSEFGESRRYAQLMVEASESSNSEQHIAKCTVRSIGGGWGPPTNCATVAITTPIGVWLRGGQL